MAYTKQNFEDNNILYASQLNHIEDGIANINTVTNFTSTVNADGDTVLTLTFADESSKSVIIPNPVNFKVVGGTTAPGSPTENMIWVNTDVAIPSWAFSAEEPGSPAAGMVWISTGTSSSVEFNALKKNDIQVYPSSANQYLDGQWVGVDAYIYKGGEWVQFSEIFTSLYLYKAGDTCDAITGGWSGGSGDGYISFGGADSGPTGYTKNKISFEGYTKLVFEYEVTSNHGSGNGSIRFVVGDRIESTYRKEYAVTTIRSAAFKIGEICTAEIDISSVTETAYIIASGWYGSGKLYNVWLVP